MSKHVQTGFVGRPVYSSVATAVFVRGQSDRDVASDHNHASAAHLCHPCMCGITLLLTALPVARKM